MASADIGEFLVVGGRSAKLATSHEANKLTAITSTASTTHDPARRALGEFLRTMRGRVAPSERSRGARRRVRGLRREEVAMAAGISLTWYTWLEQGRPVRASVSTLRAVGRALRLAPAERAHLLHLATAALGTSRRQRITRSASEALRALVLNLSPHPAYAVNALWDVLCWNRPADAVLGTFDREPGRTDNVLRRLMLDPEWRDRFVGWEDVARSAIAQFRGATGQLVGRPIWRQFIARLSAESSWFAAEWAAHAIAPPVSFVKVVRHPVVGTLSMVYASLAPDGESPDVRVIVYAPVNLDTTERLDRLTTGDLSSP